jgi:predicted ester cyclase
MRNVKSVIFILALFLTSVTVVANTKGDTEKNKKVAEKYHELKAENVKDILCEDFVGRTEKSMHTWDAASHEKYLASDAFKQDSICEQIAEGDWVATRFVRTTDYNGQRIKVELMHFKKFRNGKIAEIWEYGWSDQLGEYE